MIETLNLKPCFKCSELDQICAKCLFWFCCDCLSSDEIRVVLESQYAMPSFVIKVLIGFYSLKTTFAQV